MCQIESYFHREEKEFEIIMRAGNCNPPGALCVNVSAGHTQDDIAKTKKNPISLEIENTETHAANSFEQ